MYTPQWRPDQHAGFLAATLSAVADRRLERRQRELGLRRFSPALFPLLPAPSPGLLPALPALSPAAAPRFLRLLPGAAALLVGS